MRTKSKYEIVRGHETYFEVIDRDTNEMYERFSTYDVKSEGKGYSAKECLERARNFKHDLELEDKMNKTRPMK